MTRSTLAVNERSSLRTSVLLRSSSRAKAVATLPERQDRPLALRSIKSPLLLQGKERPLLDLLRSEPRQIRTKEAAREDVLDFFLSSSEVAPNAQELVREAASNHDLVLTHQMDIEGRIDGPLGRFMGKFGKGTASCFIGRAGKDKEFFLHLKDALMANHWTAELMYKYNLVWDLRHIDRQDIPLDQRIKILDVDDSGEAPEFVDLQGMPPIHDAQAGRTNYTRVIMRTILPRVQKKMEKLARQSQKENNDLKRAGKNPFFKPDAQGKGLACLKKVQVNSPGMTWNFELFLRGIEDSHLVHTDLVNQLMREGVDGIEKVRAISIRIVCNQLSLRVSSALPKDQEDQLIEKITEVLDRILLLRAVSDTHFGDYGWNEEKVKRFVHFLLDAAKNGHMVLFNGDVFEGWRKNWDEIVSDPLYAPIWKAMRRVRSLDFNIGNHDYQLGKVEDLLPELQRLTHDVKVRLETTSGEMRVSLDDLRFFYLGEEVDQDELEICVEDGELVIHSQEYQKKLTVRLRQDRYIPSLTKSLAEQNALRINKIEYGERVRVSDSTKYLSRGLNFDHGNKGDPYNYGSHMYDGFRWASRASTIMKFGISSEVLEDLGSRFASIRNSTFRIRRKIFQYVEARRLGQGYMDMVDFYNSKESPINLSMYVEARDQKAGLRFGLARALDTQCGVVYNGFGHTHEEGFVPTENTMLKKTAQTLGEMKVEKTEAGELESGHVSQIVQTLSWLAKPQRVYVRNGDAQRPAAAETIPSERVTSFHAFYRGNTPLITAENYYETYRGKIPYRQLTLF